MGDSQRGEKVEAEGGQVVGRDSAVGVVDEHGQPCGGIDDQACQGVCRPGHDVRVDDLVGKGCLGVCDKVLVIVEGVEGMSADLGRADGHGLVLVAYVGVYRDRLAPVRERLECDESRLVGDTRSIEGEGYLGLAGFLRGREICLGGDFLAVYQELIANQRAILIGRLDHEGALEMIGLAGGKTLVVNGVDDAGHSVGDDDLVAVKAICGGRGHGGRHDGHGLALVARVRVRAELDALVEEGLEDHELGVVVFGKIGGIESEGHGDLAFCRLGTELSLGGDGGAVVEERDGRHVAVLIDDLLHEGSAQGVGLAGGHVAVAHSVGDGDVGLADELLIAVRGVNCRGRDRGRRHVHGLLGIVDIGVGADLDAGVCQGLEGDERGGDTACQGGRIEGEGHVDVAFGPRGHKLGLCGDFLAVYQEFICYRVAILVNAALHQGPAHAVGLAGREVLVMDGVGHAGIGLGDHVLVAVDSIARRGGDARRRDRDGLALVGDVGVHRDLAVLVGEGLEGHEARLLARA